MIKINRLKNLRKEKSLSGDQVAEFLNISTSHYYNLENEIRDLSPELLNLLADFYGVSIDYILGRDNISPAKVDELPKDLKVIMKDAKELTPDQIKIISTIIKEFRERNK